MASLPHSITSRLLPKKAVDRVLLHLMKQWMADARLGIVKTQARRPSFVFQYHKAFQMKNRMILVSPHGKALCLLKTQFAKKPKNPV